MKREKELLKNTLILGIGKMLPKLASFVTLPILTARLTKAEYGTYDLIVTLIMLVLPIATLQIQSAAFRFLIDCRKDSQKSACIITNIFVVTIPISLCISFLMQFFFNGFSMMIRILLPAYFFLDTINLTCGQAVRGLGKNKEYSFGAIIVAFIDMCLIFVLVQISDKGLAGVLLALVIANMCGAAYKIAAVGLYKYIDFGSVSMKQIKELLAYSWPMVPNNLSTWILKLSDRLVITACLGIEANAVYAVANKIPNILSMAQHVMVMAWHENASIAVQDADASEYYSKMLDATFSLMYGITCLLIAATPFIFSILIRGDYSEAYYQMPILILAMFFFVMSSYFGGIYIAHKKTVNVGISTVVAAVINLSVDLLFVNRIGIWAGSISTLVAYAVLYFYRMFNSKKFQPMDVNFRKQILQIVSMIVMLVLCFMRWNVLNGLNMVLGISLFIIFNKDITINLFDRIRKKLTRRSR